MLFPNGIEFIATAPDLYPNGLKRAKERDAGIDLIAAETVTIEAEKCKPVNTGLRIHIGSSISGAAHSDHELGVAGLVLPRSGLGGKGGIVIGNLVGVIDEGYQGDWLVYVWNRNNDREVTINRGDRFAQFLLIPVYMPKFRQVSEFTHTTDRGTGGFGSTGN